jgi:methionyl-tRNA formyltransferase
MRLQKTKEELVDSCRDLIGELLSTAIEVSEKQKYEEEQTQKFQKLIAIRVEKNEVRIAFRSMWFKWQARCGLDRKRRAETELE